MATAQQAAWVERVLGIRAGGAARPAGPWTQVLPIWRDAKETVDRDITRLQASLKAVGDDDLDQIAEYGLYGVTTGEAVRLIAALHDADAKGGAPDARAKLSRALEDYRGFLDGAPIVDLLERNDWHPVPLRKVLGGALDDMKKALAA